VKLTCVQSPFTDETLSQVHDRLKQAIARKNKDLDPTSQHSLLSVDTKLESPNLATFLMPARESCPPGVFVVFTERNENMLSGVQLGYFTVTNRAAILIEHHVAVAMVKALHSNYALRIAMLGRAPMEFMELTKDNPVLKAIVVVSKLPTKNLATEAILVDAYLNESTRYNKMRGFMNHFTDKPWSCFPKLGSRANSGVYAYQFTSRSDATPDVYRTEGKIMQCSGQVLYKHNVHTASVFGCGEGSSGCPLFQRDNVVVALHHGYSPVMQCNIASPATYLRVLHSKKSLAPALLSTLQDTISTRRSPFVSKESPTEDAMDRWENIEDYKLSKAELRAIRVYVYAQARDAEFDVEDLHFLNTLSEEELMQWGSAARWEFFGDERNLWQSVDVTVRAQMELSRESVNVGDGILTASGDIFAIKLTSELTRTQQPGKVPQPRYPIKGFEDYAFPESMDSEIATIGAVSLLPAPHQFSNRAEFENAADFVFNHSAYRKMNYGFVPVSSMSDSELRDRIAMAMKQVKPEKSAGSAKLEGVQDFGSYVTKVGIDVFVQSVVDRIRAIDSVPLDELDAMTSTDVEARGLSNPYYVMVKNEPHTKKKLATIKVKSALGEDLEGTRARPIWVLHPVDKVAEIVLTQPLHEESNKWRPKQYTNSFCGIDVSSGEEPARNLREYVDTYIPAGRFTDIRQFDMHISESIQRMVMRNASRSAHHHDGGILEKLAILRCRRTFYVSQGKYAMHARGGNPSGSYITSWMNTQARTHLEVLIHAEKPGALTACTYNSDDGMSDSKLPEDEYCANAARYGFDVREFVPYDTSDAIEFCSIRWPSADQITPEEVNHVVRWAKVLASAVSKYVDTAQAGVSEPAKQAFRSCMTDLVATCGVHKFNFIESTFVPAPLTDKSAISFATMIALAFPDHIRSAFGCDPRDVAAFCKDEAKYDEILGATTSGEEGVQAERDKFNNYLQDLASRAGSESLTHLPLRQPKGEPATAIAKKPKPPGGKKKNKRPAASAEPNLCPGLSSSSNSLSNASQVSQQQSQVDPNPRGEGQGHTGTGHHQFTA
jgi:hypothetical protein